MSFDIAGVKDYYFPMKIVTGKIVAGQVVIEGAPFDEGAMVTVFSQDEEAYFDLDAGQEAELLLSIDEAERGDLIPASDLLRSLQRRP